MAGLGAGPRPDAAGHQSSVPSNGTTLIPEECHVVCCCFCSAARNRMRYSGHADSVDPAPTFSLIFSILFFLR